MRLYICKLKLNYMELVKDDIIKKTILVLVLLFGVSLVLGATSNFEPDFYDNPYTTPDTYDDPYTLNYDYNNYDSEEDTTTQRDDYVDGVCGASVDTCINGTFLNISDSSTHYLWNCIGLNGGSNALCNERIYIPNSYDDPYISGSDHGDDPNTPDSYDDPYISGSDHGNDPNTPDSYDDSYASGSDYSDDPHTPDSYDDPYTTNYDGDDSEEDTTTQRDNDVDGVCGASVDTCIYGTFSNVSDSSTHYLWNCLGLNGGSNALCSSPIIFTPVNGVCGAGVDTCIHGTFSNVSDSSTHYLWRCLGLNGGSNALCSSPIIFTPVNGVL